MSANGDRSRDRQGRGIGGERVMSAPPGLLSLRSRARGRVERPLTPPFDRATDTVTPKHERPRCGARCRTKGGAPCQAPAVWDREHDRPRNGRCRMHGGNATGPKTPEGLARTLAAMRAGRARWLAEQRARRAANDAARNDDAA